MVGVAAVGLMAWTTTVPGLPGAVPPPVREVARGIGDHRVVAGILLVALPSLFGGTIEVLAPLRLDDLGASGLVVGGVFLVAALIEGGISPLVGRLSDRRGRLVPLRIGLIFAIPMGLVLPLPGAVGIEAVVVIASFAVLATFWAPAMALLSDAIEDTGPRPGLLGRGDEPRLGGGPGRGRHGRRGARGGDQRRSPLRAALGALRAGAGGRAQARKAASGSSRLDL